MLHGFLNSRQRGLQNRAPDAFKSGGSEPSQKLAVFLSLAASLQSKPSPTFRRKFLSGLQLPRLSRKREHHRPGPRHCGRSDLIRVRGYGFEVRDGRIDSVMERFTRGSGNLTSENAAGFHAFRSRMGARFCPSALAVSQIEGPITLAAYLFHKGRPFLSDAALFSAIAFHISQIVCWQIERLKSSPSRLLFVDEPALCLQASVGKGISEDQRLSALAAILEDARARGAFAGLHCCAERPFERMCLTKPDILSFDAHQGLELFFADRFALNFIRNGGWIAYGMVPTMKRPATINAAALFTRWLKAAALAGDPQELANRAMITATCGLGLLDASSVAPLFNVAHGVGRLIKRLAGNASVPTKIAVQLKLRSRPGNPPQQFFPECRDRCRRRPENGFSSEPWRCFLLGPLKTFRHCFCIADKALRLGRIRMIRKNEIHTAASQIDRRVAAKVHGFRR